MAIALATNISAPTVYVVPRQIKNPAEAAEQLASVLNMSNEKAYGLNYKKDKFSENSRRTRKISHQKAKEIRALGIEGIYIGEDSKRHYPFGNYLSHVLGFAGIDNQGLMGLELFYDKELSGERKVL